MSAEMPIRPINNEAIALKMAYAEKPFQDMRINAQRTNRPELAAMLGKKAFWEGEKAYVFSELGYDASPILHNIGITPPSELEFAFDAALSTSRELEGFTPPGPPTDFGTILTDRAFQYDSSSGTKVPYDHPAVVAKVNIIKDMLGVDPQETPSYASTPEETDRGHKVFEYATNMGVVLFEVLDEDQIKLYAKRFEPETGPTQLFAISAVTEKE